MEKRKLKIDQLTIKSFVLAIDSQSQNTVKGRSWGTCGCALNKTGDI